jgi:hypothetical protein
MIPCDFPVKCCDTHVPKSGGLRVASSNLAAPTTYAQIAVIRSITRPLAGQSSTCCCDARAVAARA